MSRILEKCLPADKSPEFDKHDDPDNEEFIMENYKGSKGDGKFIPINEVADKISDEDGEEEIEEAETEIDELVNPDEELAEVRNDINKYWSYKHRGPKDAQTIESFHVDHDTNSFMAVTGKGDIKTEKRLDPSVDDRGEYLEDTTPRRGINFQFTDSWGQPKNNSKENLKTEPDNKKERRHRGLLRSIFHDIWTRN